MDPIVQLTLDVAQGYLIEKALDPLLAPVWRVVKSVLFPRWGEATSETRLRLREHFEALRARGQESIQALQFSLKEGEADALAAAFVRAAAQATTDERLRMLAAAAAGVFTADLDSDSRARVQRAIEGLQPSDAIVLADLARTSDGTALEDKWWWNTPAPVAEALRAIGAVEIGVLQPPIPGEAISMLQMSADRFRVRVTTLGHQIVTALQRWKPK